MISYNIDDNILNNYLVNKVNFFSSINTNKISIIIVLTLIISKKSYPLKLYYSIFYSNHKFVKYKIEKPVFQFNNGVIIIILRSKYGEVYRIQFHPFMALESMSIKWLW